MSRTSQLGDRGYRLAPLLFIIHLVLTVGLAQPSSDSNIQQVRIISNVPSATEICFALGLEHRLVGVTDFCTYPEAAKNLPKIGGIMNPDLERVLALKPTFIIVQDTQTELIQKYRALNQTLLIIKADAVEDVLDAITSIGAKAGCQRQASELNAKLQHELDAIKAAARKASPVRTLLVIGHEPGSLRDIYVAGIKSFYHRLLELSGGINCIEDASIAYPKISKESLLQLSPAVIIILHADNNLSLEDQANEIALWKTLSFIDAVKSNRVFVLHGEYLFIPGPRMIMIVRELFAHLHPDLSIEPARND